jgi:hypothetical protein
VGKPSVTEPISRLEWRASAMSPSIRTSSDPTSWTPSLLSESISLSLRHGERESARPTQLNTSDPSHNSAEG